MCCVRQLLFCAQGLIKPLKLIFIPLRFLLERLVVVSCLNYETQKNNQRLLSSQQSARFNAISSKGPKGPGASASASARPGSATAAATAQSSKAVSKKQPGKNANALILSDDNDQDQDQDMGISRKNAANGPSTKKFADFDDSSHTEDKSLTFSEKVMASGGLSKKNRAVSFRSSKVALDVNYEDELDGDQPEYSFSAKFQSIKRR